MKNILTAEVETGISFFKKGFLLALLPSALLLLPLFFHRSAYPQIGPYNSVYFIFLAGISFLALTVSSIVGWLCSIKKSFYPLFWLLSGFLVITISGVLGEFFLRIKFRDPFYMYEMWGHEKSILFGFEAKPNHHWKKDGVSYSTDTHGFRTHVNGDRWEEEKGTKIFVLGASSAFGFGLNDGETWPSLLENQLRSGLNQSSIYVINAANSGHNSLQTLLRFYLKVRVLKPTHIIYYENINDIAFEKLEPDSVKITKEILFSKTMGEYVARINKGRSFYRKTLLSHFLASKLLPSSLTEYMDVDEQGRRFRDEVTAEQRQIIRHNGRLFITNARNLAALCKLYNVKLILTTFLFDAERQRLYAKTAMNYHNQLLRGLAESENLPLVDLETDFQKLPNKDLYFSPEDHYHPTKKGAEFIAGTLATELIKNGEL